MAIPDDAAFASFDEAVSALKAGRPVIFPTDTVYGLGVSVAHASSPHEISELKGRDADKPIAWLVGGIDDLARYGVEVPSEAYGLARSRWPGSLTVIVRASNAVPHAYRSPRGTIGLRMPDNETVLALIEAVGSPLATSSANLAGAAPASSASDLDQALMSKVAAVLRDDAARAGRASTVIDCSYGESRIVRP